MDPWYGASTLGANTIARRCWGRHKGGASSGKPRRITRCTPSGRKPTLLGENWSRCRAEQDSRSTGLRPTERRTGT